MAIMCCREAVSTGNGGMGTSAHAMADRTPMTMEQHAQQLHAAPDNGLGHWGKQKMIYIYIYIYVCMYVNI